MVPNHAKRVKYVFCLQFHVPGYVFPSTSKLGDTEIPKPLARPKSFALITYRKIIELFYSQISSAFLTCQAQ